MRKGLARILIVITALTGLTMVAGAPAAVAHHEGGHHCKWNPHTHPPEFYEGKSKAFKRRHHHHAHQCHAGGNYPPG
jgi:hypothetical protein